MCGDSIPWCLVAAVVPAKIHAVHDAPSMSMLSGHEWVAAMKVNAGPPAADDVTVLRDGRRLDTKEKVLAWLGEIEAERVAGVTFEELFERYP